MSRRFDADVLVIGSDAVALALACDLLRAGVRTRVVPASADGRDAPTGGGAEGTTMLPIGLRAPALDVLADLGVRDEVVASGVPVTHVHVVVDGGRELAFDTPAVGGDGACPILVPRATLEEALESRLEELGGGIDRGALVLDAALGGGGVYVLESDAGGQSRTARYRYVVDTVGVIRDRLRVGFAVRHVGRCLAAPVASPGTPAVVTSFLGVGRAGGVVLPAVGGAAALAVVELGPGAALGLSGHALREAFEALGAGARTPVPLGEPVVYATVDGIADRFREGRVLLAGRAAHVQGPLDVQTTNLGLEDAHQLGWKLARVVRGVAGAELLDTHDAERRPIAEEALQLRARERRLLRAAPGASFSRRDVLLRALEHAFLRDRLTRRWQRLASGAAEATRGPGARAPDAVCRSIPDGAPVELGEVLAGAHFTLIALVGPGPEDRARSVAEGLRRTLGHDVGVVAMTRATAREVPWADWTVDDAGGEMAQRLGLGGGGVVLVRPDRRIMFAGVADPARVLASLGSACAPLASAPFRTAL